jgi:hypothetical protein
MADAPDPQPANLSEPDSLHSTNPTDELELGTSTGSGEQASTSSGHPAHTGSVELVRQAEEPPARVDTPWFRMEPDITRAVISKTEEELLNGLSALMRNRIENEKIQRQMSASLQTIEDTKKELQAIKSQIRTAEDELAARTKEHAAAREEIAQTQQQLQSERSKHLEHQEAWFKTRHELEETQRSVQSAASELGETQETGRLMKAQVAELKKEITRLLGERESMLAQLQPIREELDQRLVAREAIIEQVGLLHQHVESLTEEKSSLAKATPDQTSERAQLQRELEQSREETARLRQESQRLRSDHQRLSTAKQDAGAELSDVQGRLNSLRFSHAELLERIDQARLNHFELQENIKQAKQSHAELLENIAQAKQNHTQLLENLEQAKQALTLTEQQRDEALVTPPAQEAVKEPEAAPVEAGAKEEPRAEQPPQAEPVEPEVPLFLIHPTPPVSRSWDSYVLESEFFTEEALDAPRVAELVSSLPGIEHSVILQQFGPMLADRFPQRLHALFQVPGRDYSLLYDRLPNKVRDYPNLATRVSTYQIGDEFLTLSGLKDVFLAITHEAPDLRPGVPEKIAIVAEELGKMYPGPADKAVGVAGS